MRRPGFRHRLEHRAFRVTRAALRWIPEPAALAVGSLLGAVAGSILRMRRRDVDDNLRRAFPRRPPSWRRRVARACYRHLGREAVATLLLSRMSREDVAGRTEVEGLQELMRAVDAGSGVVLVTGHLGNWEVGGAALAARGVPLDVVAQRQANPLFDDDLVRTRESLGMTVIERGSAPRAVLRSLRKGRAVALVADQNVRRGGLFVDFFGVPAATARGPALFALRTGAPMFLAIALRVPGRRALYRLAIEPVEAPGTGEMDRDVRRLTELHVRRLQAWVERTPEQYFWHHRRWKTRPAGGSGLPPGGEG